MASNATSTEVLRSMELNEERFLNLLSKMMDNVESLQNNPSQGLIPREDNASDHVLDLLRLYSTEQGGPLEIERVHFTPGRGNIIIKYPGTGEKTVTFLGSHLDVVPANPETWEVDPFRLTREGDILYGRGTTDCLGHVAMITDVFASLAKTKPALKRSVIAIFIANEENGEVEGVGVDGLHASGKLEELGIINGPIYWVDSADSQPCVGTVGNLQWTLKATGKVFHSGLPHMAINPLEMLMEALARVQKKFYEDYPAHPREKEYGYKCSSTMKPTQIQCASGSVNMIPPHATVSGDCRVTPFYTLDEVKGSVDGYVAEINDNPEILPTRGAFSKYVLPQEGRKGSLELTWLPGASEGIACNLDSEGARALNTATAAVLGKATPYAISGSLPLVRWLQDKGYDVQICGFGLSSRYHAENEYCELSGMASAVKILSHAMSVLEG